MADYFVTFEYTEGTHKGGRYFTVYESKEKFDEKKEDGTACNDNEKIVYEGYDHDEAQQLTMRTTAISFVNALKEVNDCDDPLERERKMMNASIVAMALRCTLDEGVPQDPIPMEDLSNG